MNMKKINFLTIITLLFACILNSSAVAFASITKDFSIVEFMHEFSSATGIINSKFYIPSDMDINGVGIYLENNSEVPVKLNIYDDDINGNIKFEHIIPAKTKGKIITDVMLTERCYYTISSSIVNSPISGKIQIEVADDKNKLLSDFDVPLLNELQNISFVKEICVYNDKKNSIEIMVNGVQIKSSDAAPFIDSSNRTQCPVRAFADSIGAITDWDDNSKTATVNINGTTLKLTANSNKLSVNNNIIEMDTAPVFMNDRIYIPVRFVADALGYTINYRETQEISLSTQPPSFSDYESISNARVIRVNTNSNIIVGNEFYTNCYFASSQKSSIVLDASHMRTNPGKQSFKIKLMSMTTNEPLFEYTIQSDSDGKISFSENILCHESFYIKIDNISDPSGALFGELSIVLTNYVPA